ncbi:hypothetical protein GCM10020331_087310 [Ectobacillus funiculus]
MKKLKQPAKTAVIGTYKDTWTSQVIVLADNYNVLAEAPSFPDDFTANKAKKWQLHQRLLEALKKLEEINKKRAT